MNKNFWPLIATWVNSLFRSLKWRIGGGGGVFLYLEVALSKVHVETCEKVAATCEGPWETWSPEDLAVCAKPGLPPPLLPSAGVPGRGEWPDLCILHLCEAPPCHVSAWRDDFETRWWPGMYFNLIISVLRVIKV